MTGFRLDIHNQSTNAKLGGGPILSVSRFQQTRRVSRAGTWGADLAATEARINHTDSTAADRVVDTKRLVRCHLSNEHGTRELGAGIIDTLGIESAGYGMDIGGNDLSILLGNPTVHELELSDAGPMTSKQAVEAIAALASGLGLTFDTTTYLSTGDTTNGNDFITNVTNISNFSEGDPIIGAGIPDDTYVEGVDLDTLTLNISQNATATATGVTLYTNIIEHTFSGESVLATFTWLADALNESWRLDGDELVWLYRTQESATDEDDNKLYAVAFADPIAILSNDTAVLITEPPRLQRDSRNVFNRTFPYGAGSGSARETIAGVATPLPDGFSYGTTTVGMKTYYYIQHDDSVAADGAIERNRSFPEITSPTELARVALTDLRRNLDPLDTIAIAVEKVAVDIAPGQTLRVDYHDSVDGYRPLDLHGDYLVQQVVQEVGVDATYTVGLQLSSSRRWPVTIKSRLEQMAMQAEVSSSYDQPAAHALSAENIATDADAVINDLEINGVLDHDGTTVGLYNVTPVVRATTAGGAAAFVANTSGIADNTATFDGYTIGQVVKALRDIGLLT